MQDLPCFETSWCRSKMFLDENHWTSNAEKIQCLENQWMMEKTEKSDSNVQTSEHSELSAMTENSFGMFLSCLTAAVTTTYYSNSTTYY